MVRTRHATTLLLLLLAGVLVPTTAAQTAGNCTLGTAEADLDINNIFARVFNTGSLFFGNTTTNGDGYLAPKASENSPIFASGLWVGGQVNGELRVAGSRYTNFNFWPGPLGSDGRPVDPNNCSPYDEIYTVSRVNIANYEAGIADTGDLEDWPFELGAPVIDGDGIEGNYDLDAGDRPEIIGDQGIFWVMNDVGGEHNAQQTDPLGIEVQVLAWSFSRADALGETTFYRYRIINKGPTPIEDTYVSLFSDPDLGDAGDDFVSYDADLGLGIVYNSEPTDDVYGAAPPAAGYDFFQGPIVGTDTLAATAFSYFINGTPATTTGDPITGEQMYFYMQGLWGDGSPMRANGDGYQQPTSFPITKFAFPGDPVTGEFWSEVNNDGAGTDNPSGDRRFVIHTGPFTLERNDPQDIVFGIVFAQGADRFSSITALRAADRLAQTAYDNDFNLAPPPPAPPRCQPGSDVLAPGSGNCLEAVSLDGEVTLVWGYPTNSTNYLGQFEAVDVLLDPDEADDITYNFEGFNVYRYPTADFDDSARELVATYDIDNGVTRVIDLVFDGDLGDLAPAVVARGTDSGIQYSYRIQNVTNYTDYYYGVSAYSFNEESTPKVIESSPTQIIATPAGLTSGRTTRALAGDSLGVSVNTQVGQGSVTATIVDPTALTGDNYTVDFFSTEDGQISYNITNTTTGVIVLNGREFFERTGRALPQRRNVVAVDGISFNVEGPPGELQFITQLTDGVPVVDIIGIDGSGFALSRETSPRYFVAANGAGGSTVPAITNSILARTNWQGGASRRAPIDYEIRFVENPAENGQLVWNRNWDEVDNAEAFMLGWVTADSLNVEADTLYNAVVNSPGRLPFQVWEINPDGSEVQVQASILNDSGCGTYPLHYQPSCSAGNIDPVTNVGLPPVVYERIYVRERPYNEAAMLADPVDEFENGYFGTPSTIGRVLIAPFLGGAAALPAPGQTIKYRTSKPNLPGDSFTISTQDLNIDEITADDQVAALERIQVVPNPYLGASSYESGNLSRVVKFTNLPEQAATIRIFTVAGSLVKTLRKEGSNRSLSWNLETENNLPVASGMYLIHVDIDGVGERTLKLGVVQRRTQITVF